MAETEEIVFWLNHVIIQTTVGSAYNFSFLNLTYANRGIQGGNEIYIVVL